MVRPARPGHAGAAAALRPRPVAGRRGGAALEAAAWRRRRLGESLASGTAAVEIAYNERYTQFGRRAPPPKMRIMPGRYTRAAVRGGGPAIAEAAVPPRSRA